MQAATSPVDPFAPAKLGPLTLRNRIVKAATFEGRSRQGLVSASTATSACRRSTAGHAACWWTTALRGRSELARTRSGSTFSCRAGARAGWTRLAAPGAVCRWCRALRTFHRCTCRPTRAQSGCSRTAPSQRPGSTRPLCRSVRDLTHAARCWRPTAQSVFAQRPRRGAGWSPVLAQARERAQPEWAPAKQRVQAVERETRAAPPRTAHFAPSRSTRPGHPLRTRTRLHQAGAVLSQQPNPRRTRSAPDRPARSSGSCPRGSSAAARRGSPTASAPCRPPASPRTSA